MMKPQRGVFHLAAPTTGPGCWVLCEAGLVSHVSRPGPPALACAAAALISGVQARWCVRSVRAFQLPPAVVQGHAAVLAPAASTCSSPRAGRGKVQGRGGGSDRLGRLCPTCCCSPAVLADAGPHTWCLGVQERCGHLRASPPMALGQGSGLAYCLCGIGQVPPGPLALPCSEVSCALLL